MRAFCWIYRCVLSMLINGSVSLDVVRMANDPFQHSAPVTLVQTQMQVANVLVNERTCSVLQQYVAASEQGLQYISCKFTQTSPLAPPGCECDLQRTQAGAACPYDCSSTGEPGCVNGAAKELGFTGLSVGVTPIPSSDTAIYSELAKCTYWQWSSPAKADIVASGTVQANAAGNLAAFAAIQLMNVQAQQEGAAELQELLAGTPAPFTFSSSLQEDAGDP